MWSHWQPRLPPILPDNSFLCAGVSEPNVPHGVSSRRVLLRSHPGSLHVSEKVCVCQHMNLMVHATDNVCLWVPQVWTQGPNSASLNGIS